MISPVLSKEIDSCIMHGSGPLKCDRIQSARALFEEGGQNYPLRLPRFHLACTKRTSFGFAAGMAGSGISAGEDTGLNGAKLSRIWDGLCPEGAIEFSPGCQPHKS